MIEYIIEKAVLDNEHLDKKFVEMVIKRMVSVARSVGSNIVLSAENDSEYLSYTNYNSEPTWLEIKAFFKTRPDDVYVTSVILENENIYLYIEDTL